MGRLHDIVFWMSWPPPWWVWLLAAIVILIAGFVIFAGR